MAETTKYGIYYPDDDQAGYEEMADIPAKMRPMAESIESALSDIDLTEKIGASNGIAELDGNGKIPSSQLPSYADDVIVGYYYNDKFYEDSEHTTEITGEVGKIYIDLTGNKIYRFEENESDGIYSDLTDYVKNTDYATASKGGVLKGNVNGFYIGNTGNPLAGVYTNEAYQNLADNYFIGKGTLENVLTARIGDISTILQTLDTGSGV